MMTRGIPAPAIGRPVVFGEVLFDRFPDGSASLGGAPFNVAWHLSGFGFAPLFVSRVGDDAPGREILGRMAAWGMETRGVGVDPDHPTGLVRVSLEDGEPAYQIDDNQAWDFIDAGFPNVGPLIPRGMLCHGTLASRGSVTRSTLEVLRHTMRPSILIDVNLRDPWWSHEGTDAFLRGARWVKLNETELAAILRREIDGADLQAAARSLIVSYALDLVIVTRGASGAIAVSPRDMADAPRTEVEVVDTVGAGDAFTAVALIGLARGWTAGQIVRRAGRFAAEICRRSGAIHEEPEMYRETLERWGTEGG